MTVAACSLAKTFGVADCACRGRRVACEYWTLQPTRLPLQTDSLSYPTDSGPAPGPSSQTIRR
jgi:hypothetical protein